MGYTCIMNMNSKHKICSCIFLYYTRYGVFFSLSRIFTHCCWYYYFALPGGRLCARITFIISYIPCNIDGENSFPVYAFAAKYLNFICSMVCPCVLCSNIWMCIVCWMLVCVWASVCLYIFCVWCETRFVFFPSNNNDAFSTEWASTSVHKIISDKIMTIHAHLDCPNIGCFEINLQINGIEI